MPEFQSAYGRQVESEYSMGMTGLNSPVGDTFVDDPFETLHTGAVVDEVSHGWASR